MKNEKLILFILALTQFTHIIDFMIIMPLGAQLMEIFSISPKQFSLIVSSYAITAFFASLLGAMFIDRWDRKIVLLVTFTGFTIGTLACSAVSSYELFLVARSFTGAFGGMISALVLAIIGDIIPFERRGAAMGIVMTAFSVASVVGVPAGIVLAAEFTWRMPFIAVGGLGLVMIPMIFFIIPPIRIHLESNQPKVKPFEVIRNIARDTNQTQALLFSICLMLGHFIIIPFIAPYMQLNIGFSDHQVSYIYLAGGSLTAILLPIAGIISDRVGHLKVFTAASVMALISVYAITNLPAVSIIIALCATSSYFIVSSGRSVPATTMITSVVKAESRGSFMSIRSSANELALAISSLVAGMIIIEQPDGSLGNYHYVGYIAIGMSILAILLARRLKTIS
ncbi:MAG: MFS transporter [Bacteroidota bacterium]